MDKTRTCRKTVHWVSVSNSPKRCPYRGVKIYVLNVTFVAKMPRDYTELPIGLF